MRKQSHKYINWKEIIKDKRLIILIIVSIIISCKVKKIVNLQSDKIKEETGVPQIIKECFEKIDNALKGDFREQFINTKEDELIQYHRDIGRWIRNNCGLWQGGELQDYFEERGISHPDDMSHIIIIAFHRYLKNKDINLEQLMENYKQYLDKMKQKIEEEK